MGLKHSLVDQWVANMSAEIQAEEDKAIFDALDEAFRMCCVEGHTAYGKPLSECLEDECIARHIHDS